LPWGHVQEYWAHNVRSVAELNGRAREWTEGTGRLVGPEVLGYRSGDRVIATSPVPGAMVTSERGTVAAVHDAGGGLVDVWTDDGRVVRLEGEQVGRLGYGYATTVHRAQGATVDQAHVYADGGGREVNYVAMSRARGVTRVYLAADGAGMAVEALARDWRSERHPVWAWQTGLPATEEMTAERVAALSGEELARVQSIASGGPARRRPAPGRPRCPAGGVPGQPAGAGHPSSWLAAAGAGRGARCRAAGERATHAGPVARHGSAGRAVDGHLMVRRQRAAPEPGTRHGGLVPVLVHFVHFVHF
jgi:hypothetical protein